MSCTAVVGRVRLNLSNGSKLPIQFRIELIGY